MDKKDDITVSELVERTKLSETQTNYNKTQIITVAKELGFGQPDPIPVIHRNPTKRYDC